MFSFSPIAVFLIGISLIFITGLSSFVLAKKRRLCVFTASYGAAAGSLICLIPSINILLTGKTASARMNWLIPNGSFFIEIDSISAFFLICIFILSASAAIYGSAYLHEYRHKPLSGILFFFNVLVVGMAMVVAARNAILFLTAWEVMSLASFFLVTFEDDRKDVRQAGWTYLVATHIGTAFLLVMFALLGKYCGSLDFDRFAAAKSLAPATASLIFILSLIGFGTKAGLVPFHIWLPQAHPAAPSHVSALMSGVMIKTGIYGIIRILTVLPVPADWWGRLLIISGMISGIMGVLLAIAQHDIKRLLAYHSVENIGIITMGLGLGVSGLTYGNNTLAVAGFAGAILHVLNHGLFKGLLFLGAGAVVASTHTRQLDQLGGIGKKMAVTSVTFLIGAVAICGIPPLNGFISEFMIYSGAFKGIISKEPSLLAGAVLIVTSLALIGGLALACFTKVYGIVFLGEPRSSRASNAHEVGAAMRVPMIFLALSCIAVGLSGPLAVAGLRFCIAQMTGIEPSAVSAQLAPVGSVLLKISVAAISLSGLVIVLLMFRRKILSCKTVGADVTWDCGYAKPTVRMQYTASSFAQPLLDTFKTIVRINKKTVGLGNLFPEKATFESHTPEPCDEYLFRPVFQFINSILKKLRWLQHGNIQLYILYIALTLIILMVWKLR